MRRYIIIIIIIFIIVNIIIGILVITFTVRVKEGVSSRLCRPHRLQPLAVDHSGKVGQAVVENENKYPPLHVKALPQSGLPNIDVVLLLCLLGGKGKRVIRVGGMAWGSESWR